MLVYQLEKLTGDSDYVVMVFAETEAGRSTEAASGEISTPKGPRKFQNKNKYFTLPPKLTALSPVSDLFAGHYISKYSIAPSTYSLAIT